MVALVTTGATVGCIATILGALCVVTLGTSFGVADVVVVVDAVLATCDVTVTAIGCFVDGGTTTGSGRSLILLFLASNMALTFSGGSLRSVSSSSLTGAVLACEVAGAGAGVANCCAAVETWVITPTGAVAMPAGDVTTTGEVPAIGDITVGDTTDGDVTATGEVTTMDDFTGTVSLTETDDVTCVVATVETGSTLRAGVVIGALVIEDGAATAT